METEWKEDFGVGETLLMLFDDLATLVLNSEKGSLGTCDCHCSVFRQFGALNLLLQFQK